MKQHTTDNMAEYSYNKSVEYILQVSISDNYAFRTDHGKVTESQRLLPGAKMQETLQYFIYWQPVTFAKRQ